MAQDVLERIASLLESEFGGFYLSAPDGTPLAEVRDILRRCIERDKEAESDGGETGLGDVPKL